MPQSELAANPVVWWVNHYAVTPDMPGGTRHYDMGIELARRGFRVRIFASDVSLSTRKRTRLLHGELYQVERRGDLEFVWVRSAEYESNNWRRILNMLSFALSLRRVARLLAREEPPDVVIGSSPHPFAAYSAERTARRIRTPFLLELRDLWPQALVDMGDVSEKQLNIRLLRRMERHLYAHADRFIVLARGSQDYLEVRGIDPAGIAYIPNGVHTAQFRCSSTREQTRRHLGFERFTIVYTGAHGPANSLETALDAAARLGGEPVEFVLVGDGPSKSGLLRLAEERKLTNVRFLAPIAKAKIPDLLGAADAGLITLKNARAFSYGISPNKLFDYMAAGLPVICSVPGEMADMVEQAGAGLVCPPESAEALASAAQRVMAASPAQRTSWAEAGRQFVHANYRREVLADRLVELIQSALRDGSRQTRESTPCREVR